MHSLLQIPTLFFTHSVFHLNTSSFISKNWIFWTLMPVMDSSLSKLANFNTPCRDFSDGLQNHDLNLQSRLWKRRSNWKSTYLSYLFESNYPPNRSYSFIHSFLNSFTHSYDTLRSLCWPNSIFRAQTHQWLMLKSQCHFAEQADPSSLSLCNVMELNPTSGRLADRTVTEGYLWRFIQWKKKSRDVTKRSYQYSSGSHLLSTTVIALLRSYQWFKYRKVINQSNHGRRL